MIARILPCGNGQLELVLETEYRRFVIGVTTNEAKAQDKLLELEEFLRLVESDERDGDGDALDEDGD